MLFSPQIFHLESVTFQQLPELINHYLQPPDPIIIHYQIKPNEPPPPSAQAWDVEVKVEDTSLKSRMNQVILNMSSETAREKYSSLGRFKVPARGAVRPAAEEGADMVNRPDRGLHANLDTPGWHL